MRTLQFEVTEMNTRNIDVVFPFPTYPLVSDTALLLRLM